MTGITAMSRFGFLARKPGSAEKPNEPAAASDNPLELDEELFSALGAQLGGENEALRNLLLDANNKIGELDTIKAAVGKLVDPVSKALRDFEAEKTEKVGLQSVLNNTRTAYGKLRNEVGDLEKKLAAVRPANARRCARTSPPRRTCCRRWKRPRPISPSISPPRRAQIADLEARLAQRDRGMPSHCARRTAASTNGWSPPKSARSRLNPISAPRASGC